MNTHPANESAEGLEEAAADWYLRLSDCAPAERASLQAALQDWLSSNPAHEDAFARVGAVWKRLDSHAMQPELRSLRQAALEDAHAAARTSTRDRPGRWRLPAAAAAGIVFAIICGAFLTFSLLPEGLSIAALLQDNSMRLSESNGTVYQTGTGERRTIVLSDTSAMDIDAESEVSVQFRRDIRLVRLQRGRAYFQIAKDMTRPFVVEAAGRQIVATGTAFDVELLHREVRVNLVEGHVIVKGLATQSASIVPQALSPGEQLTAFSHEVKPLVRKANVQDATSWRQGKLIFDDEPLVDAVARVERYGRVDIVLADDSLADLRVTGVFNAGDVPAFIGALQNYFAVQARWSGADSVSLSSGR